jgi:DNA-binding MarR family transcriptional regulator
MVPAIDPKNIRKIDGVIHEPSRLSIVLALQASDTLSFSELKSRLGMTDGNLSIHLRKLEENGYVTTQRSRAGGKPRKLLRLSGEGRLAFDRYLTFLDQLVRAGRDEGGRHGAGLST